MPESIKDVFEICNWYLQSGYIAMLCIIVDEQLVPFWRWCVQFGVYMPSKLRNWWNKHLALLYLSSYNFYYLFILVSANNIQVI